ncbi:MAG: hypothetical protein H7257_02805 [Taibaiella sp.]|nr:hypothetical protein [Taibaiella sp.]
MKRYIALALIFLSLLASCREDDIEPEVEKCKIINQNLNKYTRKTFDYTGQAENAAIVTGYLDGEQLKMARASAFTDLGRKEDCFYFHKNKLIAVKQEEYLYNKPSYFTEDMATKLGDSVWYDDAKTVMKTNWYYFYSGKLVKWINPDHRIMPETDKQYDFKNDGLLSDAEKLKKMMLTEQ